MIHQWLYGKVRYAYNIPTKDIHVALFLTDNLKFSYDFKVSKPKRSKRLYICLVPLPTHTHKGRNRRETRTKVRLSERFSK